MRKFSAQVTLRADEAIDKGEKNHDKNENAHRTNGIISNALLFILGGGRGGMFFVAFLPFYPPTFTAYTYIYSASRL